MTVSREHWSLVADRVCRPSWDRPLEIKLHTPLVIPPHGRRALYCHSGLPDDLGIQYQSYPKSAVVGEDQYLRVLPGLGHTGSRPFDDHHGWYRSYRGLAGSVGYVMQWKGWSIPRHLEFPLPLRQAVKTMLLCNHHLALLFQSLHSRCKSISSDTAAATEEDSSLTVAAGLGQLPVQVVFYILEFMHYDWFEDVFLKEDSPKDGSSSSLSGTIRRGMARASYTSAQMMNLIQLLGTGQVGIGDLDDNQAQTLADLVEHLQHEDDGDDEEEENDDYEDDGDDDDGNDIEFIVDVDEGHGDEEDVDDSMDMDQSSDEDEDDDDNDLWPDDSQPMDDGN
jgi:hypothetical protein